MIRSMYAAVSGLRSHQEMINVTGNNIANVNTAGFKRSQTLFQEVLGQTVNGAAAPTATLGGTNPAHVGLGVRVGAVSQDFNQGAINRTGRVLDLAIEGDGFFMAMQDGQALFSRAGSFSIDALGRVTGPQGGLIQGWQGALDGTIDINQPLTTLRIPIGDQAQPVPTTRVQLGGNLPADATVGPPATQLSAGLNVFDERGEASPGLITFTRAAAGWTLSGTVDGAPMTFDPPTLTFDAEGNLPAAQHEVEVTTPDGAFTMVLGGTEDARRLTEFAGQGSLSVVHQDGSATGTLQSLSIGQDGVIFGSYTNGRSRPIGQFAMAVFANPSGLERVAGTNFRPSPNSGLPQVGTMGTGGRGLLNPGSLEGSNVDLAEEFTDLIRGQRGFQANSRVITTSDEMLQEVVNLKR